MFMTSCNVKFMWDRVNLDEIEEFFSRLEVVGGLTIYLKVG